MTAKLAALIALVLLGCGWAPALPSALPSRPPVAKRPSELPSRPVAAKRPFAVARARPPAATHRTGGGTCPGDAARAVLARVNAARSAAGLRPLKADARLARVASTRAAAMARSGRLSHSGWEQALRGAGCKSRRLGENIASGYHTTGAVMEGWLSSRGHRANILEPGFSSLGVGCAADRGGTLWWTQDFAS